MKVGTLAKQLGISPEEAAKSAALPSGAANRPRRGAAAKIVDTITSAKPEATLAATPAVVKESSYFNSALKMSGKLLNSSLDLCISAFNTSLNFLRPTK